MVDAGETRGVYANHPSDDDNLQQVDPAVLNEALREMFGLHHITASSSPSVSSQMTGDSNEAANYMMTLYERYKDGSTLTYKHHPANTVRGIVPTTGIYKRFYYISYGSTLQTLNFINYTGRLSYNKI